MGGIKDRCIKANNRAPRILMRSVAALRCWFDDTGMMAGDRALQHSMRQ
jgi:hypothetical protein